MKDKEDEVPVSRSIKSLILQLHGLESRMAFHPPTTSSHCPQLIMDVRPAMYISKVAGLSPYTYLCRRSVWLCDSMIGRGPLLNEEKGILVVHATSPKE